MCRQRKGGWSIVMVVCEAGGSGGWLCGYGGDTPGSAGSWFFEEPLKVDVAAAKLYWTVALRIRPSSDPHPTLIRPSSDPHPTLIRPGLITTFSPPLPIALWCEGHHTPGLLVAFRAHCQRSRSH
ncbi:unnamed protein product [Pleuronectes platessa]|uniref:Uncharacterized protein n=1 Tax=Pleuronectes platessa TaxID=8262 RepID=A0A9N7VYA4_PLEPL|nr:unnamed protein product [Pleuronectes platessa]